MLGVLTSVVTCADCPGLDRSAAAAPGRHLTPAQVAGGNMQIYFGVIRCL